MKAAYYYSEKQRMEYQRHFGGTARITIPDGTVLEFTECDNTFEDDDDIPLQNSWDDSHLVYVVENLPVDDVVLKFIGQRVAKTY